MQLFTCTCYFTQVIVADSIPLISYSLVHVLGSYPEEVLKNTFFKVQIKFNCKWDFITCTWYEIDVLLSNPPSHDIQHRKKSPLLNCYHTILKKLKQELLFVGTR